MITLTSDEDTIQLREYGLNLLNKNNFEGLVILVETLNDTDFESELKTANFKIDAKNYYLEQAARFGYLETVKYLIEHGADIHIKNNETLRWAVYKRHWKIAQYLIEQGGNFEAALDFVQICDEEEIPDYFKEAVKNDSDYV